MSEGKEDTTKRPFSVILNSRFRILTASFRLSLLLVAASSAARAADAATPGATVLMDHAARVDWREQRLPLRDSTLYTWVDPEGGQPGEPAGPWLQGRSVRSASGWIRPCALMRPRVLRLTWRWRVAFALAHEGERTRAGDDYAARVIVVFETSPLPLRTRSLAYVWAAREPRGAEFASPYSGRTGTIVLRSGASDAGVWVSEERDVLADYRRFFGREPDKVSAVAFMVDTDDTDAAATAWLAGLTAVSEEETP